MMIHTDRLILRAFREEDAGDLLEYLSCPKVNCFMDMRLCSLEQADWARKNAARMTNIALPLF